VTPQLSVIVPTRDRAATVAETLARLARERAADSIEVVVVDDGSRDDTPAVLERAATSLPLELRSVRRQSGGGPGAARNSGLAVARAPVCLFLGDDMRPRDGLLARHREFHRRREGFGDALIGRIVPAPTSDSPFSRWLHEQGKQFAFAHMRADEPVPARLFYAANCSLKRELLESVGGFDERFEFGHEEQELGGRLERAGIRLAYDPEAIAEHDHPTDLWSTLARMRGFGRSYRQLTDLDPGRPQPRPPGPRHRVKASALTAAALLGPRGPRETTWAFLCEEAQREAFWGEPDPAPPAPPVRVGAGLARLAARDPAVRPPIRR
jgi:glycosyltransferase involved in cell wall biosynthesis